MRRWGIAIAASLLGLATLTGCTSESAYLQAVRQDNTRHDYNQLTEQEWLDAGHAACLKLKAGIVWPPDTDYAPNVDWWSFWTEAKKHLC